MAIHVRDKMFYRQAKTTVIAAFALGLLLSLIQIGYDAARERRHVEEMISAMTGLIHESALQAVFDLDDALAQRVVTGIMAYGPIHQASLVDDLGNVLASESRPLTSGPLHGLAAWILGPTQDFTLPLVFPANSRLMGHLHISVDDYLIASDFFSRSAVVLLSEFVRNIALATLFLAIFYMAVTRPLFSMIARLSAVDIKHPAAGLLRHEPRHEHDELGRLVDSINMLLSRLGDSLSQYQATQRELEGHREHLEHVVQQRTQTLRELVDELQTAKEAADAASHAKSMFLASMSHEFRTPLNAILGFTQLLLNSTSMTTQQREYLTIIKRSGDQLLTLINQVLDLSKMESGRMSLHEQEFNIALLLNSLVEVFRMRAREKHLHLHFDCAPDIPLYIRTDEVKLRQVLINLLSNAIKFTQTGSITLRARRVSETPETPEAPRPTDQARTITLLFEIEDTGIGIADEAVEQIFEAFTQTASGDLPHEGTGLGLAISRQFVRLMGGDIQVASTPGKGTIFTFDIHVPIVERAHEALSLPVSPIRTDSDTPASKILVVDDIWDNRQLLALLMKQCQFDVQEAEAGAQAFDIWKTWRPHLIWLDIRMPGPLTGYDVAKKIREHEAQEAGHTPGNAVWDNPEQTKILAVTAGALDEEEGPAREAGCDDVLHKPYRTAEVFDLLHTHLGISVQYPAHSDEESEPPAAMSPAELKRLPDELRQDLQQAIESINLQVMHALLPRVRHHHVELAEHLEFLTNTYRFDTLQELVESPGNPERQVAEGL